MFYYDMKKHVIDDEGKISHPPKLKDYEDINYFEDQVADLTGLCDKELWYQYCLKIWYYLQKIFGVEILKMNTQFSIDDDGVLWFTYAFGISVRFRSSTASPANLKLMGYIGEEDEK